MRRAVASAVISGLCLTLVACSHDDAAGPTPIHHTSTGPSVTGPATTTSTSSDPPRDNPPVMPPLAKEKSTAGAKAFIRYYIAVANYAFTTPDANPLRQLSTPECAFCHSLIEVSARLKRQGGKQTGAKLKVLDASITGEDSEKLVFLVHIHIEAGYSKGRAGGRRHTIRAKTFAAEVHLDRSTPQWQISYLEPR